MTMGDWMGMPILASEHGGRLDFFMLMVHLVMLSAFTFWSSWFVLALFKFRKKKNPHADHPGIKGRWPFIPVAIMVVCDFSLLFGLSIPYWHDEINAVPLNDPDVIEIRVVAQQFQWNIHYPGKDGVFGRTGIEFMDDQINFIGLDSDDPMGEDDLITLGLLHLPVNRDILIHLSSKDMIHSFTLNEFRIKQDAIPGMRIPIYFKPIMTSAALKELTGDPDRGFEIACSQLCGNSHFNMRGYVTVESQEEFDAWLAKELEKNQAYDDADDWFFEEEE